MGDASIRGRLYQRLPHAKGKYRPAFELITVNREIRYRLIKR